LEALLFDLGGVLVHVSHAVFRKAWLDLGADDARLQEFLQGETMRDWNLGRLDEDRFADRLREALLLRDLDRCRLRDAWCSMLRGCNTKMVRLLEAARGAGLNCFILSNTDPWHAELMRTRYEGLRSISGWGLSCEYGYLKPDRRLYRLAAERLGLRPAATLFLDDKPENVEAALDCGFQARLHPGDQPADEELWSLVRAAASQERPSPASAPAGRNEER